MTGYFHHMEVVTVGRWIRQQRAEKGWSQDELAFRSHVSPRLIGRYERGVGEPSTANLSKICAALGYTLPWSEGDAVTPGWLDRIEWPRPLVLDHPLPAA